MSKNKLTERKYKKLKDQGIPVYSISRINTYNTCPYAYYRTYILKDRGVNNAYGVAGTAIHDWLESIQNGSLEEKHLQELFGVLLLQIQLDGLRFPTKNIGQDWEYDIKHFVDNFKKLDVDMITEKQILYEIDEDKWLQGYIDAIGYDKNGDYVIMDWKTSGMFTGKRLTEAGRQLLLYKDAIDSTTDKKVDKVCWYMIKYLEVTFGGKTRVLSRRKWVDKSKNNIKKALTKEDREKYKEDINSAIRNNDISKLPKYVQDQFEVKPHIKFYSTNQKKIDEAKKYVVTTIDEIESNNPENIKDWKPCDVSKEWFFCQNLCNHGGNCKYLKQYYQSK